MKHAKIFLVVIVLGLLMEILVLLPILYPHKFVNTPLVEVYDRDIGVNIEFVPDKNKVIVSRHFYAHMEYKIYKIIKRTDNPTKIYGVYIEDIGKNLKDKKFYLLPYDVYLLDDIDWPIELKPGNYDATKTLIDTIDLSRVSYDKRKFIEWYHDVHDRPYIFWVSLMTNHGMLEGSYAIQLYDYDYIRHQSMNDTYLEYLRQRRLQLGY